MTPAAEDKPTDTWNYFDKLLPIKVGGVIHRPLTDRPHEGSQEQFPALPGNESASYAAPTWETKRFEHTDRISAHYVSVTGQPLTYRGYMDPYAYADIDNRSTHSTRYTQALADMHAKAHVRPIADRSPTTFPVDVSRKYKDTRSAFIGSETARKRKASPSPEPVTTSIFNPSRAHTSRCGVKSCISMTAPVLPRLAHPSYYAPLWVAEWQGHDDPMDALHFMPRTSYVPERKRIKIPKTVNDGWEDFLRDNASLSVNIHSPPTSEASIKPAKQRRHTKLRQARRPYMPIIRTQWSQGKLLLVQNEQPGQSTPVINPVKQRRHIELRQVNRSQRIQTTTEDLRQWAFMYTGMNRAKGRPKQQRKSIVLETAIHPKAQRKRKRGTSDNYNKTHAADDEPYTKVLSISTTTLLSVQSTPSVSTTPLQHESDYAYEHHSTQNSATLDAGVSLDMCPTTSTDNTAKETRDDSTATVPMNLGKNLQYPQPITTEDDLNRTRGHSDRLLWAPANSNEASTRTPLRPSGLRNYSAEEGAILRPAGFPAGTIDTLDNGKSSRSIISTGMRLHVSREAHTHKKDVFSQRTGLTRYPARSSTTPIGSTTPFTVASAGSSPTTELMPCSQLTTDQQFAQILSLCQTSMTDTRGLCTELSNDRDTQAQINMDLRNSLAKAHAAINSLTSMLHKCPLEATTISTLHCPTAQRSFVNPTSGTISITSSQVEGPDHEDEPTHDPASSDTEFAQILTLCQTGIIETRGVRAEISYDRDTQARINTDLQNSLARAHAAIDALTSTLQK